MFSRIIKKIIARKAGKYSATVSAVKGAEPVAYVGTISAIAMMICKALGVDIDEKTIAEIMAGATSLYGVIKAIGNHLKNKNK
jgi:acid phosphatase family membrane protein YuiD